MQLSVWTARSAWERGTRKRVARGGDGWKPAPWAGVHDGKRMPQWKRKQAEESLRERLLRIKRWNAETEHKPFGSTREIKGRMDRTGRNDRTGPPPGGLVFSIRTSGTLVPYDIIV